MFSSLSFILEWEYGNMGINNKVITKLIIPILLLNAMDNKNILVQ